MLRASTGESVSLENPVIVGRAPSAEGRGHGTQTLRVPSPSLDISRNHLFIELRDGAVQVTDESTNGTLVRRPGQDPQPIGHGRAVTVEPGSVLDLGDGVTIDVTNA